MPRCNVGRAINRLYRVGGVDSGFLSRAIAITEKNSASEIGRPEWRWSLILGAL